MSLYLEQIRQLVELQEVDDAIMDVENELNSTPATFEELKSTIENIERQKEKQAEKMAALREQESRVNAEMEEEASRLRKSKSKMQQVANSREYQAMARELDGMEKIQRSREEDHAAITDEIKLHTDVMANTNVRYDTLKEELTSMQSGMDDRMASARNRLDELNAKRTATGNSIPKPVLERYEFIRRRLSHPIIVSVTDGICNGCHISIPPQTYIELQGGQKILNCPNCQRLMYWDRHFKSEGPAENQPTD